MHRHWPIPGQYVSAGLYGIIYHKIGEIFDSLEINLKRTDADTIAIIILSSRVKKGIRKNKSFQDEKTQVASAVSIWDARFLLRSALRV